MAPGGVGVKAGEDTSPESPTVFCQLGTDGGGQRQKIEKGGGLGEFSPPTFLQTRNVPAFAAAYRSPTLSQFTTFHHAVR